MCSPCIAGTGWQTGAACSSASAILLRHSEQLPYAPSSQLIESDVDLAAAFLRSFNQR